MWVNTDKFLAASGDIVSYSEDKTFIPIIHLFPHSQAPPCPQVPHLTLFELLLCAKHIPDSVRPTEASALQGMTLCWPHDHQVGVHPGHGGVGLNSLRAQPTASSHRLLPSWRPS